ncbi:T9SS type A sorting domain-containing protein [Macellibacteroides fermentans]|uniref:T9SS type A sorting domain-containing protein n=1 Tax=Macellibacteroides fermentans TaxID=879969 RepID=UPI00406C5C07
MKKNLLLTFFLLCMLPLAVFAVEDPVAVTVTLTKPTNSYVEVTYTPFGTTTETTKEFKDIDDYEGTISILYGASVKVKVTPISSFAFHKIVVNGGTPIVENDYTIANITEAITINTSVVKMYTFTITKPANCDFEVEYFPAPLISQNSLSQTVTPDEAGDVTLKVKNGTSFSFKVIPDEGYALEEITASNTTILLNPYLVPIVNSDMAISASVVKTHTVTIAEPINSTLLVSYTEPLGSASKQKILSDIQDYDGAIVVKEGTPLTVAVNPSTGYQFSKTLVGSDIYLENPTLIASVTKDLAISTEVVKKKYTLTITPPSNGSITVKEGNTYLESGDEVEHGAELTVTATPQIEHDLEWLKVNGTEIESGSPFTVTGPVTIGAEFIYVAPKYTITFDQPDNGELTVRRRVVEGSNEAYVEIESGSSIAKGTVLYLYAAPATNYVVSSFKVNNTSVDNITDYPVLTEVKGPTTIAVAFIKGKQLLTITPPVNGEITVKDNGNFVNSGSSVDRGTVLTLNAYAKTNYKFKKWWDGNTDAEREIKVDVKDLIISAEFVLITGIEELYTGMSVYAADGAIYLNGVTEDVTSVSIIDMAGKIVYNSKPEFGQTVLSPVNRGVYVVLVKGIKGNVSTKVIVK